MPSNPDERGPGPNLPHLEALARAATADGWEPEYDGDGAMIHGGAIYIHDMYDEWRADAAYIAAANPATVLTLIERVREVERQRAALAMVCWQNKYNDQCALEQDWPNWRDWAEEGSE